jgi:hypothetical protein
LTRCWYFTHILVLDQSGGLLKSDLGGLLDVRLGVPNGTSKDGNKVRHSLGHLDRSRVDHLLQNVETAVLNLPFTGSLDLLEQSGEDDESSPWVHRLDDSLDSGDSGSLDGSVLVGESLEKVGEGSVGIGRNDVWLEELSGTVLAKGRNGGACGLSGSGRLFVGQCLEVSMIRWWSGSRR